MQIVSTAGNGIGIAREERGQRKRKAAFLNDGAAFLEDRHSVVDWVYGCGRRKQVEALTDCLPAVITLENFFDFIPELNEVEVIFSTWGMPCLSPAHLEQLPNLRALFFAGGSVSGFARPLLERGVAVVSAWGANAIPVAEFTLGQILLSNKGYFRTITGYNHPGAYTSHFSGKGNYGETVALLGMGQVGRKVVEMLRGFSLEVIAYDPFLSGEEAVKLGVEKVSLQEAFARGLTVSNHLADVPATVGMLDYSLFSSMREGATFINTGRGVTVVEDDLIRALSERSDLTALLDVTHPEPPVASSPLYTLPNVRLTPHIAGSKGDEVFRMADYVIEEFKAWEEGRALRYAVTLPMLATLA